MAVFYRYDYIEITKNIHPCGQADRKGGGVNPPWPDHSICENFNTFFLWNMIP